jgi:hypothetical protein
VSFLRKEREKRHERGLQLVVMCEAEEDRKSSNRVEGTSPMAETPETYTRTISTMSAVLDVVREEPDPDGTLTALAERIAVEREWVRVLMALGEEPRRPPPWLGPRRATASIV